MRKQILIRTLIALVVLVSMTATVEAFYGVRPRGDWQVLSGDGTSTVVRVWVINTGHKSQFALVTFVAHDAEGVAVTGFGTVFVPARSSRPVSITVPTAVPAGGLDPTIIVRAVGGGA